MIHLWRKPVRAWTAPDGTSFRVEVTLPGTSSALIIYHSADTHRDRYATWQAGEASARSVTARLDATSILPLLTDEVLRALWLRSAPRSPGATPVSVA